MEVASDIRYGPCPSCSAINMAHRSTCYRCRAPLNGAAKPAATRGSERSKVDVKSKNLRKLDRQEKLIPNVLIEGEVPLRHRVTVMDLSPIGLKIRSATPIRIGARVKLSIPIAGKTYPIEGAIRYRASTTKEESTFYVYGVKLDAPSPALRQILSGP